MKFPNLKEEKHLWEQGYEIVVGLDEAGRGPLAGHVVAAAVLLDKSFKKRNLSIRDSKKLSAKQREFFYAKMTNHKHIKWGVGIVSEKIIDQINILEATKMAMQKAIENMGEKPQFLLLDGNFRLNTITLQKSVIAADEKIFSCSAAGIIAKVTRDRIMQDMHKYYPEYGFNAHKGYGTPLHLKKLEIFGPSDIHRKTFWPIKAYEQVVGELED